jgi:hypothetical protein
MGNNGHILYVATTFGLEATQRFRHRVKDFRRLEITVELQDECEVRGVKAAVSTSWITCT